MIPEPDANDLKRYAEVDYPPAITWRRPDAAAWIRRAVAAEREVEHLKAELLHRLCVAAESREKAGKACYEACKEVASRTCFSLERMSEPGEQLLSLQEATEVCKAAAAQWGATNEQARS